MLAVACTTKAECWNKYFIEYTVKDCIPNKLTILSLARKVGLLIWLVGFGNLDTFIINVKVIIYSSRLQFPSKFIEQRFRRYGITEFTLQSISWINSCEYICRLYCRKLEVNPLRRREVLVIASNVADTLINKLVVSKEYLINQQIITEILLFKIKQYIDQT